MAHSIRTGITELLKHHEWTPCLLGPRAGTQCPPPGTPFPAWYGHLSPKRQQTHGQMSCKTSSKPPDTIKRNKYQMIKPLMTHRHTTKFNHSNRKVIFEIYRKQIQVSSKWIRSDWKLLWPKYVFKKVTAGVIILARLSMHSAVCLRLPRAEVHSACLSNCHLIKKNNIKEGH